MDREATNLVKRI